MDKLALLERAREKIKARFPEADLSKLPLGIGTNKGLVGEVVSLGKRGGEVSIFKKDGNITKAFETQFGSVLGSPAEKIIAADNTSLQDTQRRLDEAQQTEARLNAQAQNKNKRLKNAKGWKPNLNRSTSELTIWKMKEAQKWKGKWK